MVGEWLSGGVADAACQEIHRLLRDDLTKVAERDEGWTVLYRSSTTSEFWELSYPASHLHGGGPPRLDPVTTEEATARYGGIVDV